MVQPVVNVMLNHGIHRIGIASQCISTGVALALPYPPY